MFADLLRKKLAGILDLSAGQLQALESHYQLLLRWNSKLNLTRVRDLEQAVERHYCESLFLAAQLPAGSLSICDIGSGPGFPGLPVAIVRPDCRVTLIESHQRKSVFLREASRSLPNVAVLPKRAEAVESRFDLAISRAVSYEDLVRSLKKLAAKADLLAGAEEPTLELGFAWQEVIPLPWGRARFLRKGSRVGESTPSRNDEAAR